MTKGKTKINLICKEETYEIVGVLYEVYNQLNYGYREKFYQDAIAYELKEKKIRFSRELYIPLMYKGHKVGRYFVDFLIDDKIVLEVKVANRIYKSHMAQVLGYLRSKNLRLGIVAAITPKGIKFKRLVNSRN